MTDKKLRDLEAEVRSRQNGRPALSELESWAYENRAWLSDAYCPAGWMRFIADFANDWIKSGFYRQAYRLSLREGWAESPDPGLQRDGLVYKMAHHYYCHMFHMDPVELDSWESLDKLQMIHLFNAMPDDLLLESDLSGIPT